MTLRRIRAAAWVVILCLLAVPLAAQTGPVPAAPGILTIDLERLFAETAFGGRIQTESEALAEELQAENRRIEAELTAGERELTEQRPTLPVEEFRALADAFDEKADRFRSEQNQKAQDIQEFRDAGRQDFFNRIGPVLLALVRERGGVVLLDRRAVFLSAGSIDITEAAIERIDAEIGAGTTVDTEPE